MGKDIYLKKLFRDEFQPNGWIFNGLLAAREINEISLRALVKDRVRVVLPEQDWLSSFFSDFEIIGVQVERHGPRLNRGDAVGSPCSRQWDKPERCPSQHPLESSTVAALGFVSVRNAPETKSSEDRDKIRFTNINVGLVDSIRSDRKQDGRSAILKSPVKNKKPYSSKKP